MGEWFKRGLKDPVDAALKGVLGEKIGGYLGSQGMGHEIEKWSNPVTQVVNNPILGALKGDYEFGKNETGWMEDTVNNVNELGALLYGGYTAAGALGSSGTSGMYGMEAGSEGTSALSGLSKYYPKIGNLIGNQLGGYMDENEEGSGNWFTRLIGGK